MAGDIHDIGKIYVPAEILSKPGQITEIEYSIIKNPRPGRLRHPQVDRIPLADRRDRLPAPRAPGRVRISQRPEGDDILLEARILSVADVVEAMSSHRPYRPAHGIDKALEEITRNSAAGATTRRSSTPA